MGLFDFFKGKKEKDPLETEESCISFVQNSKPEQREAEPINTEEADVVREADVAQEADVSQEAEGNGPLALEEEEQKQAQEGPKSLSIESEVVSSRIQKNAPFFIQDGTVVVKVDNKPPAPIEKPSTEEPKDTEALEAPKDTEVLNNTEILNNEVSPEENDITNEEPEPSTGQTKEKEVAAKGFFSRLWEGLQKTRTSLLDGVDAVLGNFTVIDEDLFEELEEVLIMADIGVKTTTEIIDHLKKEVKKARTTDPETIKTMLIEKITHLLSEKSARETIYPQVILIIGVNGVGKTTTIGKLANLYQAQGKKVLLAAADTFRAAAIDQLQIWGDRAEVSVISHEENSDPAAVVFDAVKAAKNRGIDVLLCDTAGRLHNKKNLMEELKKIDKVIEREYPQAQKEVFLVLDATTGQNALQQAKLFQETAEITGIVLTKLDGTAKGGIVIGIQSELNIPVRYIGVGEGIGDLQAFQSAEFAKALFNS